MPHASCNNVLIVHARRHNEHSKFAAGAFANLCTKKSMRRTALTNEYSSHLQVLHVRLVPFDAYMCIKQGAQYLYFQRVRLEIT